jgi:hypothetical protein
MKSLWRVIEKEETTLSESFDTKDGRRADIIYCVCSAASISYRFSNRQVCLCENNKLCTSFSRVLIIDIQIKVFGAKFSFIIYLLFVSLALEIYSIILTMYSPSNPVSSYIKNVIHI